MARIDALRANGNRTPLVIVAGLPGEAAAVVAESVRQQDPAKTALVHHGLRDVTQGIVRRHVVHDNCQDTMFELAHGCPSCILRGNILPILGRLSRDPDVHRIVVHLDPALKPEPLCWALRNVVRGTRTLDEALEVQAVITVLDTATWWADAISPARLGDRGLLAAVDDERSLAHLALSHVESADALVLAGAAPDGRTTAALDRLAPTVPRIPLGQLDSNALLAAFPDRPRCADTDDLHGPLLRGKLPPEPENGISAAVFYQRRPFHPERLRDALAALPTGVLRLRGRAWVANQPDIALRVASAGGHLHTGHAGQWLVARTPTDRARWAEQHDVVRRALASQHWDPRYGDRHHEFIVVGHQYDATRITSTLKQALLTKAELTTWRKLSPECRNSFTEQPVAPRPHPLQCTAARSTCLRDEPLRDRP